MESWEFCHRSEVQVKAGKSNQTQGHMKKKIADLQRQIKQTAKDTARYYCSGIKHWGLCDCVC